MMYSYTTDLIPSKVLYPMLSVYFLYPLSHLTEQGAEKQLDLLKRIYPDADLQVVPNKAGGWGVKIIIEDKRES